MFTAETGIEVEVRYGSTAELAATLLEEGDRSPADIYWAQDAGALGAMQDAGMFATLPAGVLERVDQKFRSVDGSWVGVTGRVRTVVYNTDELSEDEVPDSVFDLTEPEWQGRVGWAPTNGSFQSFVTAMREIHGEDTTREWLEGMLANDVKEFESNTPIVDAVGRGEISVGLVNHYYLYRFLAEDPDFPAANKFLSEDVGGLVNVAGIGILQSSSRPAAAQAFAEWVLGPDAQGYFSGVREELEYPLATDVTAAEELPALDTLNPPDLDLSSLDDLEGTLQLLREVGALE
jgi:iron(III) transport system substrate-binding protein